MRKSQFDLVKFIFSFVVIAIHAALFQRNYIYPFARIAVPVYFLISSYLVFSKLKEGGCQKEIIIHYVIRNMKLYLFWFVVFAPLTFYVHAQYRETPIKSVISIFFDFMFGNTFYGSWYIMASILSVSIVWWANKHVFVFYGKLQIAVLGFLYIWCCLTSNYFFLLQDTDLCRFYLKAQPFFGVPYNNFIVGIVWVMIGKFLAEYNKIINNVKLTLVALVSLVMLYFEKYFIATYVGTVKNNDCYFMLIPVCVSIFLLVKQHDIVLKHDISLRKLSTIIYCCHLSVLVVIREFLGSYLVVKDEMNLILFIMTTVVTLFIAGVILFLSKYFNILKNAY